MTQDTLVQIQAVQPRLPVWLRKGATHFKAVHQLKTELRRRSLHTVCESARCPNIHECFERGAATFMILGNLCTRGCGFCSVPKGSAAKSEFKLDPDEPRQVAEMAAEMRLRYVVITAVNRDDLADGGSQHFAETVREVRSALPGARIEVLTPDFCGDLAAVARVLDAGPQVFNHNMETVSRLYRRVRPQANYRQSLEVLRFAKQYRPDVLTKSGMMVGLGETADEVQELLRDIRSSETDIATIGQYLQPTRRNLPVAEFVTPRQFDAYRDFGLSAGFQAVFSGPLVRSSYMADQVHYEASEEPAHNGLAGSGQVRRVSPLFGAASSGLCASEELRTADSPDAAKSAEVPLLSGATSGGLCASEKLAHNGLAGCGQIRRVSLLFGAASSGLCASEELRSATDSRPAPTSAEVPLSIGGAGSWPALASQPNV